MARSPALSQGESLPTARNAEQPDLFGESRPSRLRAAARKTDPATSHKAAQKATRGISLKQLAVLECFQRREEYDRASSTFASGMIDETLIRQYGARVCWWPAQTESGLRTRRSELVTLGYLRASTQKGETTSGNSSTIWELTPSGAMLNVQAFRTTLENKLAARAQHRQKKRAGDLAP